MTLPIPAAADVARLVLERDLRGFREHAEAQNLNPASLLHACATRLAIDVLDRPKPHLCSQCGAAYPRPRWDDDPEIVARCPRCRGWTWCWGAWPTRPCTRSARAPHPRPTCDECEAVWFARARELEIGAEGGAP